MLNLSNHSSVVIGVEAAPVIQILDLFNPSLEWDSLPNGTWNNLGSHTCNCISASVI